MTPRLHVKDPKALRRLMAVDNISARQLATGIGYRSHSYVNRILAGDITTITPQRAASIAKYLRVSVQDLFVPSLSTDVAQSESGERAS